MSECTWDLQKTQVTLNISKNSSTHKSLAFKMLLNYIIPYNALTFAQSVVWDDLNYKKNKNSACKDIKLRARYASCLGNVWPRLRICVVRKDDEVSLHHAPNPKRLWTRLPEGMVRSDTQLQRFCMRCLGWCFITRATFEMTMKYNWRTYDICFGDELDWDYVLYLEEF